jgi:hypothetical protein
MEGLVLVGRVLVAKNRRTHLRSKPPQQIKIFFVRDNIFLKLLSPVSHAGNAVIDRFTSKGAGVICVPNMIWGRIAELKIRVII